VFDAISPAAAAADLVAQLVLNPERAARLVQQHALDPAQPGLAEVIDSALAAGKPAPDDSYQLAVGRAVQRVMVDRLMWLAQTARSPEAKAIAQLKLRAFLAQLPEPAVAQLAGAAEGTAH